MGKRSSFKKNPRDYYQTFDRRAGDALWYFLADIDTFAEPFVGNGALVHQLQENHNLRCMFKSDIEPQPDVSFGVNAHVMDFRLVNETDLSNCDVMITNPPFTKGVFHEAIEHFTPMIDCWWLNQADYIFNKGSSQIIDKYVTDVVTIGRLKWFKDTNQSSVDNFVWIKTSRTKYGDTKFHNLRGV